MRATVERRIIFRSDAQTAVYIVICFPSNELLFSSVHVSRLTGGLARLSTDRDGRMWAGRTRKCAHVRAERTSARPPASRCCGQTSDARAWESGRPRPVARPRLGFLKKTMQLRVYTLLIDCILLVSWLRFKSGWGLNTAFSGGKMWLRLHCPQS